MTAENQFAVVLIKDHLSDFRREHILDDSDRLASLCVPNLYIFLASYKYFKALLAESSAANCFIIGKIRDKRPSVLEDCEVTGSSNQASVFRNSSYTFDFASVIHVKSLDAAVVQNAPHLDHSL